MIDFCAMKPSTNNLFTCHVEDRIKFLSTEMFGHSFLDCQLLIKNWYLIKLFFEHLEKLSYFPVCRLYYNNLRSNTILQQENHSQCDHSGTDNITELKKWVKTKKHFIYFYLELGQFDNIKST